MDEVLEPQGRNTKELFHTTQREERMCDFKLNSQEIFQLQLGRIRYNGDIKQVLSKYSFNNACTELQLAQEFRLLEKTSLCPTFPKQHADTKTPLSCGQSSPTLNGLDTQTARNVQNVADGKRRESVPNAKPTTLRKGFCSNRVSLGESDYRKTLEYANKALDDHVLSSKSGLMHDLADDSDSDDSSSYESHKQVWSQARIGIALDRLAYYANVPKLDRHCYGHLRKMQNHYHLQPSILTALRRTSISLPESSLRKPPQQEYVTHVVVRLCELLFVPLSPAKAKIEALSSILSLFRFAFSITGFDSIFERYILDDSKRVETVEQVLRQLSTTAIAYDGDERELSNYLSRIHHNPQWSI